MRWYRTPWFWVWMTVAVVMALFSAYWWEYQTPDPANIAPGGWGSDSSRTDAAFVRFFVILSSVPIAAAIALAGGIRRARGRSISERTGLDRAAATLTGTRAHND